MKRTLFAAALAAIVLVTSGVAGATDLFGVEATYSAGTITQTASSLPDLVDALVNNQGDFAPLLGNDFTGSLTYYGIPADGDVQGETNHHNLAADRLNRTLPGPTAAI
jgi:hypothetical protein